MSWIIYAFGAILATGFSDFFRKLGSNLNDPFFSNLVFQTGTFSTAIILYLLFSRKIENQPRDIMYAVIGGILISIFTTFSFKALSTGPGVSTVIPVLRIGGVVLVFVLGIILLREKLTLQTSLGLLFSMIGVYLLFTNK